MADPTLPFLTIPYNLPYLTLPPHLCNITYCAVVQHVYTRTYQCLVNVQESLLCSQTVGF